MTEDRKAREVRDSEARKSALLVACALSLIAAWNLYRGRTAVVIILGVAAFALALAGLLLPALARRFHVLWMWLAGALGYVNSRVLLTLVFYLLLVPYNLVARLIGRDPLNRRKAGSGSYWIPREATRQTKEQFERLF